MKKTILSLCFLLSFLFSITTVSALSTASTGIYQLKIRDLPTTDSLEKGMIPAATIIILIEDTNKNGNGCDDNWFKIKYNDITGYACSTYLNNITWEETNTPETDDEIIDNPE